MGREAGLLMGAPEVEAFLTHLTVVRKVSASTQNQALQAILFLYRRVLGVELPWLTNEIVRHGSAFFIAVRACTAGSMSTTERQPG